MSPVKSPDEHRAPDIGKKDKTVVEKIETEELPPGWITEVKLRKSGSTKTKYDRNYTDPVTGYIFHSMKDVQRYLKTGEVGRLASKPKDKTSLSENDSDTSTSKKIVSSPLSEVSRQKRPLEDRSKLSLPSQRPSKRPAGEQILTPEPKTRQATRLAGVNIDAPPPPPEAKANAPPPLSPPEAKTDTPPPAEPKTLQVTRLAGVKVDDSASSLPEPKTRRATRSSGIEVDASGLSLPELKPRSARRLAAIEIDAPPAALPEAKTCQATPPAGTETVAPPPSPPEAKTRQAKRQAGIRADVAPPPEAKTRRATRHSGVKIITPPPSPPDTRTTRRLKEPQIRNSINYEKPKAEKIPEKLDGNADVDETRNSAQEEKSTLLTPATQETSKKQELHTISPKEDKRIETGPTVIPVDNNRHEKQKSPVVNPTVTITAPQNAYGSIEVDTKPESSTNYSMNDFWTDPCIEFAVKTLTGAIPFNELNKANSFSPSPPLEVPIEDLWTDPCIEFAVKTLTGAIPINEDPYVQDYLQHQRSASSADTRPVHNYSLPHMGMNFCQTEVLSKHYETGLNNNNNSNIINSNIIKQDSMVGPTLGNGAKGNIIFPQGNNGQCSRSRFFQ